MIWPSKILYFELVVQNALRIIHSFNDQITSLFGLSFLGGLLSGSYFALGGRLPLSSVSLHAGEARHRLGKWDHVLFRIKATSDGDLIKLLHSVAHLLVVVDSEVHVRVCLHAILVDKDASVRNLLLLL